MSKVIIPQYTEAFGLCYEDRLSVSLPGLRLSADLFIMTLAFDMLWTDVAHHKSCVRCKLLKNTGSLLKKN